MAPPYLYSLLHCQGFSGESGRMKIEEKENTRLWSQHNTEKYKNLNHRLLELQYQKSFNDTNVLKQYIIHGKCLLHNLFAIK